jgi:hypothetical protein
MLIEVRWYLQARIRWRLSGRGRAVQAGGKLGPACMKAAQPHLSCACTGLTSLVATPYALRLVYYFGYALASARPVSCGCRGVECAPGALLKACTAVYQDAVQD